MPKPINKPELADGRAVAANAGTALIVAPQNGNAASTSARAKKPSPKSEDSPIRKRRSRNKRKRRKPPRRVPMPAPRVSIGAALRQAGFDEHAIARQWVRVVSKLTKTDAADRNGVQKLLVDVLKECSRQVDSANQPYRSGDAPVIVQLVHTVSRPPRVLAALASANPPATPEASAVAEETAPSEPAAEPAVDH